MKYTFLAFFLILSGWAQSALKPADGLWRSTDDPDIGSGLMMVTQGDITLISIYSYTLEGKPKWYLAVGQVDENGLLTADLIETFSGTSILADHPDSASVVSEVRQLTIQFDGVQTARFAIDDSDYKSIQPLTFGHSSFITEHLNLSDGTFYAVPDPTGSWALADPSGGDAYVLTLAEVDGDSTEPFLQKYYSSSHSSTENWLLKCPHQFFPNTLPFSQPFCVLDRNNENLEPLRLPFNELSYGHMALKSQNDVTFVGHRTRFDHGLKPNDGYWRPEDDPDIGSGVVMTTQGDVTVVLIYSYDDLGLPVWRIASGVFDAQGLLQTPLISTTGGSPIEVNGKTTAIVTGLTQSLEIQLIGTELATFSIDGSTPKHIQVNNFGAELYSTEQVQVNEKSYQFPDQAGQWLVVDNQLALFEVVNLNYYDPNATISPAIPYLIGARAYSDFGSNQQVDIDFTCSVTTTGYTNVPEVLQPYCLGTFYMPQSNLYNRLTKLYFQDIGVNNFRSYLGPDNGTIQEIENLDRSENYIQYYRLD